MDSDRFDALTRSLSEVMTRRGLTRLLGGLALTGLLPSLASATKKGDQHETDGTGKKDGTGKTGGHGNKSAKDNDRHKMGKAERKTSKAGSKKGQTGTGKTSPLDSAAPATDTTGGSEANAPRNGKKGQQDTDETVTLGAPQDALSQSDGTVTANATNEACLPAGDSCARDRQCCSRKCTGKGVCRCNEANPCPGGKTCQNGQCFCPDGTKLCNGACIPSSDCCGNADCPSGQVCDGGKCVGGCQAEDQPATCGQDGCGQKPNNCNQTVDCGGCGSGASCVNGHCEADCQAEDPQTTCGERGCGQKTNNCGQSVACGGCGQDASCVEGRCEAISCVPEDPQTTCAGVACGTRTNNCSQDVDCGGCAGSNRCQNGQCVCPTGTHDCGEQGCVPFGTTQHCAGCNDQCTVSQVCCNGTCVAMFKCCYDGLLCSGDLSCNGEQCVCPEGRHDCGDQRCVPFGTDQHCSGCNDACTGSQACVDGACTCDGTRCGDKCPCPDGYLCQQYCSDSACQFTYGVCECDPSRYCGTACECPGEQVCSSQQCVCPEEGTHDCDGDGTCECGSGQVCLGGQCVTPACGDGACNGDETCSSCPQDCGECNCTVDTDCVPAECCHPSSCVPLGQAPICGGACDTGCSAFSMDCGQGYCACQNGQCAAVLN